MEQLMRATTRRRLVLLHRWTAIALSPVILTLIVTGAILSFAPLLDGRKVARPEAGTLDVAALHALLLTNDAAKNAGAMFISDDRRTVRFDQGPNTKATFLAIATGAPVREPPPSPNDAGGGFFDTVLRIHKNLWNLGGLVTLGAFAIFFLIFTGPLLARPGNRLGALGWHRWTGWLLWPLLAVAPLSLVLMKFHAPVFGRPQGAPMTLVEVVDKIGADHDLRPLRFVARLGPGVGFVVLEPHPNDNRRYIVTRDRVREIDNATVRFGEALHAGEWAGGWGGLLNLASMAAMLGMICTGLLSWRRRARSS
jgi:sulfite reductase (NADPH) flavoprotein alpha-component